MGIPELAPDFAIQPKDLWPMLGTASAPRIFDVRREGRYAAAERIIPGARWRDHKRAAEWGALVPQATQIVVYCEHGHQLSQSATAVLRSRGIRASCLSGGIDAWTAAGLPTLRKAALPGRHEQEPSRWVTRVRPKIDRVACPWLIRRFIDPDAELYFVEPPEVAAAAAELGAIPYDIEGVAFSHVGDRCSFDTLIDVFGLEDAALGELALIVRGADTARPDLAPEAAGLLAVALGNSVLAGGDDRRALDLGFPVYDALLAWRRFAAKETHNWPRAAA